MRNSDICCLKLQSEKILTEEENWVKITRDMRKIISKEKLYSYSFFRFFDYLDSETDEFPIEEKVRSNYNEVYLLNLDKKRDEILQDLRIDIIKNAKLIVEFCNERL